MATGVTQIDTGSVACEVCLNEIPHSEAGIVEANEYVLYFCGLECYHRWREQQETDETGNA